MMNGMAYSDVHCTACGLFHSSIESSRKHTKTLSFKCGRCKHEWTLVCVGNDDDRIERLLRGEGDESDD